VRLRNYLGGCFAPPNQSNEYREFRGYLSEIGEEMRARGPRETSDHRGSPRIEHTTNEVP
jgi:hypothetical protein